MRIPHTIPELVLRVYTRKLSPAQLEEEKNGRVLRSEDSKWDEEKPSVSATLAEFCLKKIAECYPTLEDYVKETNRRHQDNYDLGYEEWQRQEEEYLMQKSDYDRRVHALQTKFKDPNSDSSDDTDDNQYWDVPEEPISVPIPVPDPSSLLSMKSVLDQLNLEDRLRLVEEFNAEELSINLTIRIPDEHYWKKLCLETFPEVFVEAYGNSWKRLYAEKTIRGAIEFFHPFDGNWEDLIKILERYAPYAKSLTLNNLIPICYGVPLKPIVPDVHEGDEVMVGDEDEGYLESEYMIAKAKAAQIPKAKLDEQTERDGIAEIRRYDSNHLDFSLVLPKLKRLRALSIIVTMAELGLDYEPRFAEFTWTDCESLARALSTCRHIRKFELQRSHVTDEKIKLLVRDGLMKMRHLRHLNLSYNNLGNAGAKAIARLICDTTSDVMYTLHTLILASCKITRKGGKALAYALCLNSHVKYFSIRLNAIHDTGGRAMMNALVNHQSIISMDLSATHIGNPTSILLGKLFLHNTVMREINLSSNPGITNLGVKLMARSISLNQNVYVVDFRLTGVESMMEYDMLNRLQENLRRSAYTYLNQIRLFSKTEKPILRKVKKVLALHISSEEEEDTEEDEDELLGEDDDKNCVFLMKPKPIPFIPKIPAKPQTREERLIRRLIKLYGDNPEDVYEPRLKGERLDNYITKLEEQTKVIQRPQRKKKRPNRWVVRK